MPGGNDYDGFRGMKQEAQQLDFWLGEWDVTWDGGRGTNRIERILNGRIIQENFDGGISMPFRGMSVSAYNTKIGAWQQTWVDTEGTYWHFTGDHQGDRMIFATDDVADGEPIKLRMVFYNIETDQFDWDWEKSGDGGKTWELRWRIHYTRRGT